MAGVAVMVRDKYAVRLAPEQREELQRLIRVGKRSARVTARARILLKSDDGWAAPQVAEALDAALSTVYRVKQRFAEEGLEGVLQDRPQANRPRKLDDRGEAHLIAWPTPDGKPAWNAGGLSDHPSDGHGGAGYCAGVVGPSPERGFHPQTLGGDKGYDTRDCVADLRRRRVTPHVAQNTKGRSSAIDGRTTRHPGYALSQRIRKRVEEIFGWMKTVGGFRRTRYRGLDRPAAQHRKGMTTGPCVCWPGRWSSWG